MNWRWVIYLWASPTTLAGLTLVGIDRLMGGACRVVDGVIEANGPLIRFILKKCVPLPGGARAMTLGHVVIGVDRIELERTRIHERVHVRQYERWGPFFVPAYFYCAFRAKLRGGDPYHDNPFEKEAFDVSGDV